MNSFIDSILSLHFNNSQGMHPRKPGIFETAILPASPINSQQTQQAEKIHSIPSTTNNYSEEFTSNKNKTANNFQNNLQEEKHGFIKEKSFTDNIIANNKKTLETAIESSDSIQILNNINSSINNTPENISNKLKNTEFTNQIETIAETGLKIKTNHPVQNKTILPDKTINQPLFINNKFKNEGSENIANPIMNQLLNNQNHTIIKVSIGSIEVRTNNLSVSPDKKFKPAEIKRMSLDEYLQKRNID